jgi:L-2-hydroxyglutarate oxidase LhgO
MSALDWNAEATLHERDDAGSEMQYNFNVVKKAPLRDLVTQVATMSADERARLVIDVAGGKSLNVGEILELARAEGLT